MESGPIRKLLLLKGDVVGDSHWVLVGFDKNIEDESKAIQGYAKFQDTIDRAYYIGEKDISSAPDFDRAIREHVKKMDAFEALQRETIAKVKEIQGEEKVHRRELEELKVKWERMTKI